MNTYVELGLPAVNRNGAEAIPWNYNPRPLEVREDSSGVPTWQSLNGRWEFAMSQDRTNASIDVNNTEYTHTILVPFPFQAPLSGIGIVEDIPRVISRRTFIPSEAWDDMRIFVEVARADYVARIHLNQNPEPLVEHEGGYTPISAEVTDGLRRGAENEIVVDVLDDVYNKLQPRGKQSITLEEAGPFYKPSTGITGMVSLLAFPQTFVDNPRYAPSLSNRSVSMQVGVNGNDDGLRFETKILANGKEVGNYNTLASREMGFTIPLSDIIPWDPRDGERPFRYDVEHILYETGGREVDRVLSKVGLRDFGVDGDRFILNGKPIFLRWILYQDYYPDSLYLPPDLIDTERHIQLLKAIGINGIRFHENVPLRPQAEKFDEAGILWSLEFPNWTGVWIGDDEKRVFADPQYKEVLIPQMREAMETHLNSSSLVMLKLLNETPEDQDPELIPEVYKLAQTMPGTRRPAADVSGFSRNDINNTDFLTKHNYSPDAEVLARDIEGYMEEANGMPLDIDEYGGVRTNPADRSRERWLGQAQIENIDEQNVVSQETAGVWGYGQDPQTEAEALDRIRKQTKAILDSGAAGFCYTQFNNTGKEQNGLFDPMGVSPNLPPKELREIFSQPAAIEDETLVITAAD